MVRDGLTHSDTPAFRCRGTGPVFVAAPKTGPVPEATEAWVRRLLAERVGVRAIARAVGVSRPWVQGFVNARCREETRTTPDRPQKSGPVVIESDEMWRSAGSKGDVRWVWVALGAGTARGRWDARPRGYRTGATVRPVS